MSFFFIIKKHARRESNRAVRDSVKEVIKGCEAAERHMQWIDELLLDDDAYVRDAAVEVTSSVEH